LRRFLVQGRKFMPQSFSCIASPERRAGEAGEAEEAGGEYLHLVVRSLLF
jgi:hypothetical protein